MNPNRFDPDARRADRIASGNEQARDLGQPRLAPLLRVLRGTPSRRDVLRGLAATGFGLGLAVPSLAEAKPNRRKPRKRLQPVKPNRYGCLEIKDPCRRHSHCCSGICTGPPGRKRCRGHGTCNQANPGTCEAIDPIQTLCNNSLSCLCFRTTAGSSFCSDVSAGTSECTSCKRDADCVRLGLPPGSACLPAANGACVGICPTGMACMVPCGYVLPAK